MLLESSHLQSVIPVELAGTFGGVLDEALTKANSLSRVVDVMQDCVTLQLRSLDQTLPALGRLAEAIERTCDAAVSIKGFVAAGPTAGLGRHADLAEMWVVQLEGSKRWRQWAPSIPWYDQRRRPGHDSVVFAGGGRVVRVARECVPALAVAFSGSAFEAADLSSLARRDAVNLIRKLSGEGLITPADVVESD